MARRIEIELTSARPDGTWTWRAAGALKPRGVVDGSLLYEGAKAGDVVRADAEFEIEGITVVAVLPPKQKKRSEPERLEVIGPPRQQTPGVTSSLTSPPDRRDRGDGATRAPRRGGEAGSGRPGRNGRSGAGRSSDERRGQGSGGDRPGPADRPGRARPPRPAGDRAGHDRAPADAASGPRPARPSRPRPDRPPGERSERHRDDDVSSRPKVRRLNPSGTHRTAVLDGLPPEHRPIAEQVLRGGIPAVRTALHLEREKATAEGRTAPNSEALLAIAEDLLPRLKAAEWRDRAEAAAKLADEVTLRDLRSVVAGADVARDDESRHLAATLREALERRVEGQRREWLDDVTANLDDGRVVRALRVSARPPDPGSRFPAELATRLATVASQAMAPDTPPERWAALLDAVAASPVRRSVKPAGLPPEPGEALLHAARQSSGRIPALAPMLGIPMPPPPGPMRPLPRPPRPGGRPGGPGRPAGGQRPLRPPHPPLVAPAPEQAPAEQEPAPVVAPEPGPEPQATAPEPEVTAPEPQATAPEPVATAPEPEATTAPEPTGPSDGAAPGCEDRPPVEDQVAESAPAGPPNG